MYVMFLFTIVCLLLIYILYDKYEKKKKDGNMRGPWCIPFFGNAFEFLSNEDALFALLRLVKKHGDLFRVWLCSDLYIVMTNPTDIEVLLNSYKHILKAVSYKFLTPWLGNGLITSYGDLWQLHRKLLTPTFHFKILENSIGIIYKNANVLTKQLENEAENNEFNMHPYIEKCSLDIICETAMGISMNLQVSEDAETYLNAVKTVTNISVTRIFKVWLQPEICFQLSGYSKTFEKNFKIMEDVSKNVIVSKRQELIQNMSSNNTVATTKNKPFLDFLLTESQFSDDEINSEVKSFMFAGHDTTTSAISFAIYQLSKHADIQEKVYDEIMKILPSDAVCPTIQDVNNLKYLENVIKETLRLYPSVPMIGRTLKEEVILPSGNVLPANSHINIFIYSIHRNPAIFKEPENFIPERFEDDKLRNFPYAFIPFSAGPRNCIGQKLAMLEIKMVLATILRKYYILPSEEANITLTAELILRAKEGINIRLKKRS